MTKIPLPENPQASTGNLQSSDGLRTRPATLQRKALEKYGQDVYLALVGDEEWIGCNLACWEVVEYKD